VTAGKGIGGPIAVMAGILAVAIVVGVVVPMRDSSSTRPSSKACAVHPGECTSTVLFGSTPTDVRPVDASAAAQRNASSSWARGRDLYVSEGCATCHTQEVRPVLSDIGLGPASEVGDYVFQANPPIGSQRLGPDLSAVGTRQPFTSCSTTIGYLRDPASLHGSTLSPSYGHLSQRDLNDLATYVVRLRPASAQGPLSCDPNEVSQTAGPGGSAAGNAAPGGKS
jgi:cytochrome c oxidase cbb3-type subunit II